ncbi:MAG: CTP synthase [Candidatus Sungbacteria bacterium]|uniref:CTP synthase n=1 Tax=Candidatus Sungiibacteriota bacterium TaxID=2750080 RepID=A0A932YWL6_9BACT|nr:CTP synthase [Candidatus Sungbacteria bacterium]
MNTRYIFVCGGVMSGIGKGVATASIARILKSRGFKVSASKIDPYVNVDAGTMNPIEHGEVFVTEDGMECDQDVGNYERFLDEDIPAENYMTTGMVYLSVIQRERNLEYGGKCVQIVPHIPQEVIQRLERASRKAKADFMIVEIGGTVGEYENILFLEAARMMRLARPREVIFIMVSYLPVPEIIGEMKTKPTQHAVRSMNAAGIQPDIIIARSTVPMDEPRKKKLAVLCNVSEKDIISAPDVKAIYEVPINFEREQLGSHLLEKFGLAPARRDLGPWKKLVRRIRSVSRPVKIGIVGKYFGSGNFTLADSYISVIEALKHAAWHHNRRPELTWLNAELYERKSGTLKELSQFDGIVVPGGFGDRGIEGKIKAINYVRKQKIPFLGLCYGLQLAVVEFARNAANMPGAHTTEINPKTKYPVVRTMPEQIANIRERRLGGSMRLGAYPCRLKAGSRAIAAYKAPRITERHRHRYEINNDYLPRLEKRGLIASGINPGRNLVEIMELPGHPFFLGTQFHPELKSRPLRPHPLFREFIRAATRKR